MDMNIFKFWDNSKQWHGELLFTCLTFSIVEADKLFKEATGVEVIKKPSIGCTIEPLTAMTVCMASGLFNSKSEVIKAIKNKGVKISRVQASSPNEPICLGDFINARLLPGGLLTQREFGNFLTVHFGKQGKILQITPHGINSILT